MSGEVQLSLLSLLAAGKLTTRGVVCVSLMSLKYLLLLEDLLADSLRLSAALCLPLQRAGPARRAESDCLSHGGKQVCHCGKCLPCMVCLSPSHAVIGQDGGASHPCMTCHACNAP